MIYFLCKIDYRILHLSKGNTMNILVADSKSILIAASIAVTIVVIGVVLYVVFVGHIRIKKRVNEITKRYDKIHTLLAVQLNDELKRINSIADANVEYEHIYSINHDAYVSIINQEDSNAHRAIDELNKAITDKKYKVAKEQIDQAKELVNKLEKQYEKLNASLSEVINIDEENRQEILRYRRSFREIREAYELKKNELKFIESSITTIFDRLEQYFIESEKLLSAARYAESNKYFPEIEKVINALDKAIAVLPKLVTNAFVVIPANIEEIQNRYNELLKEGYPLHHLKVQVAIDSFKVTLDEIHHKLENFQTKNVEYELNSIRDAIYTITNDFDKEVDSKKYFSINYENIYNGSYSIENRFIKLRRIIPNYKSTYILKDTFMDDLEDIQNKINKLGSIKRTLDTYVHSSSQQPFSNLADRLHDLDAAMKTITEKIDNAYTYLNSLKRDTENSYKYILDTYIVLKNYESELRTINVMDLTNRMKNSFVQAYAYINQIGDIIQKMPIDVDLMQRNLVPLKDIVESITIAMKDLSNLSVKAEDSIVYANRYREGFYEVKTTLIRAEKAFFEGDFIRTCDESLAVIKKNLLESGK